MRYRNLLLLLFIALVSSSQAQGIFWKQTNGPQGGYVATLCFQETTILAGGSGGVFKSIDGGEHWMYGGLAETEVTKVAVCESVVVAGTDRNGVFRWGVRGTTWTQTNGGLPSYVSIVDMAVKDTFIFAATRYDGLFRSSLRSATWQAINAGMDNRDMRTIIVSNEAIIASAAGAGGSGMFRSTDYGQTWIRRDPNPYAWMADAVCEYHHTLFATRSSNQAKVYLSTDDGNTWNLPAGALAPSDIIIGLYADQTGLYAGIYNHGLYRTKNGGVSWVNVGTGLYNQSPYRFAGNGTSIYSGSFDGVHKTTDAGAVWQAKNDGMINGRVTCMASAGGYLFAGTEGAGLFRTSDLGNTWVQVARSAVKPFVSDIAAENGLLYILNGDGTGGYGGKVLLSIDLGKTWIERNYGIDAWTLNSLAVGGNFMYVASDYGIFKGLFGGSSWTLMANGLPNNGRPNASSVAASGSVVIAANGESRIYRSADAGDTWTAVSMPPGGTPPIVKVAVVEDMMFAGCSQVNFLFRSSDKGVTWQRLETPLVNGSVEAIAGSQGAVYVAVSGGGVISSADGSIWHTRNAGLMNMDIRSIYCAQGRVWAGSWGAGVFRSADSTELAFRPGLSSVFLEQNYPNPFNSQTTIRFIVPYASAVKVVAYNLLGQRVATVVNEQLPIGIYSRTWDASGLPSGIYFYRVETGKQAQTVKALLIR